MRVHSLRRTIWLVDGLLVLAVLGAGAWWFFGVRKALAEAPTEPRWLAEMLRAAENQSTTQLQTALVGKADLEAVDRPEYKQDGRHYYWQYIGGLPPPPPSASRVEAVAAPQVNELERIGKPTTIFYEPPGPGEDVAAKSLMVWEFTEKSDKNQPKMGYIQPGNWIRPDKDEKARRFKLLDIRKQADERYRILYAVYDDPDGEPVRRSEYLVDAPPDIPESVRDRIHLPSVAVAEQPAGAAPAPGGGAIPAVAQAPGPGPVPAEPPPAAHEIRPTIRTEGNVHHVEFDDMRTYDYFRKADPEAITKTVKTAPHTRGGQVVGLRITGLEDQSPLQRFDVKPGDILISINGQPAHSEADVLAIARGFDENTSRITVVIERNARQITFQIDPRDPHTRRAARNLQTR